MKTNPKEFDIDAHGVLNRLAEARGIASGRGRDAALARELSITPKRLSGWRERNSLEHALIILKCREWALNINWVYFEDGGRDVVPAPPTVDTDRVLRRLIDHLNTVVADVEKEDQKKFRAEAKANARKR